MSDSSKEHKIKFQKEYLKRCFCYTNVFSFTITTVPKVYYLLGLNHLFIHALYGLPSIVNENVKIGDFKPAIANLKSSTNHKLLPSTATAQCATVQKHRISFLSASTVLSLRRIILTTAEGQSLPVSVFLLHKSR